MRTKDVIEFFSDERGKGGYIRTWKLLGLSSGMPSNWGEVIPRGLAYELQALTGGLLKVDLSCYEPLRRDSEEARKALTEWISAKRN